MRSVVRNETGPDERGEVPTAVVVCDGIVPTGKMFGL